jgi:hypothetical protein
LLDRMKPLVQQYGSAIQRSVFYQCVETDILGRGRYAYSDEAVSYAERAVRELADSPSLLLEHMAAQFNLGFALVHGAEEHCRRAADVLSLVAREADRMEDATLLSRAMTYWAVAVRRLGRVEQTETLARRAFVTAEAAHMLPYMGAAAACASWAAWKKGDLDKTQSEADAARRWWLRGEHAFPFRWLANVQLLDICTVREEFNRAGELLADMLAANHQVFPEPLAAALGVAERISRAGQPAVAGDALRRVLQLFHAGRYL